MRAVVLEERESVVELRSLGYYIQIWREGKAAHKVWVMRGGGGMGVANRSLERDSYADVCWFSSTKHALRLNLKFSNPFYCPSPQHCCRLGRRERGASHPTHPPHSAIRSIDRGGGRPVANKSQLGLEMGF